MDPRNDTTPGGIVPQPQQQAAAGMAMPSPLTPPPDPAAYNAPSVPPPSATPGWLPPTVPLQAPAAQALAPAPAPQQPGDVALQVGVPVAAEDSDLIEKEWVIKAKQIVDATRQDPYEQTKQIGKFKAEYMKKRYNKTIGQTDD